MPLKSLLCIFPFVFALAFAPGCFSAVKLGGVTLSIAEISPGATSDSLRLKLVYNNENIRPLALSNTDHTLYLGGKKIASVESREPVGLPSMGTATQILTVRVSNPAALAAMTGLAKAEYRLINTLHLEAGEDEISIKTTTQGTATLSGFKP